MPKFDADRQGEIAGKAFIMFGAVRPSLAQLQEVYTELFGPLLCVTCG